MPKKRKKDNTSHYARYVLEEIMIAIVIVALLLFFFMWSEGKPFYGEASGGSAHDPQFAAYISQCSKGIPQACDKIGEAAENVQIETAERDYERDALRAQRMG